MWIKNYIIIHHILISSLKKVTNHNYDNRRKFVIQNHYFTYQRRGSSVDLEVAVQALNIIVADLQNQINNLNSNQLGGDGGDGVIGVM